MFCVAVINFKLSPFKIKSLPVGLLSTLLKIPTQTNAYANELTFLLILPRISKCSRFEIFCDCINKYGQFSNETGCFNVFIPRDC